MKKIFKFLYLAVVALILLFGQSVSAQVLPTAEPLLSLSLQDTGGDDNPLQIEIQGTEAGYYLNLYFKGLDSGQNNIPIESVLNAPGAIPWNSGSVFTINIPSFYYANEKLYQFNFAYDEIVIKATHDSTNVQTGILQTFQISNIIEGQGSQNTNNVDFSLSQHDFKNTQPDGGGYWAFRSTGTWNRENDVSIYLIMEDVLAASKTMLCEFTPGGNQFLLNFPSCAGQNNPNIVVIDGVTYAKITGLAPGRPYKLFFSDTQTGDAISQIINLDQISEPINTNAVVENIVATPKQQGGKKYFEITGNITQTKPNTLLNFSVIKNGNTSAETIGEVPYTITTSPFNIPDAGELENIGGLAAGQYTLEIREIGLGGTLVQSYIIPAAIPDNPIGDIDNGGGSIYTQEQQTLLSGGLVSQKCGYKNAPGGWKLCGFTEIIELVQKVIEYIFILVLPIAAIVFAYAGFLFMTSGEDANKRIAAKTAMKNLVIGIIVIMLAWLIVKTVLKTLGVDAGFTMFLDIRN